MTLISAERFAVRRTAHRVITVHGRHDGNIPRHCPLPFRQVNIQIDQSSDPMHITVAGQPHTVDTAAAAVSEIINGGNPFGAGGPASLGGALSLNTAWKLALPSRGDALFPSPC